VRAPLAGARRRRATRGAHPTARPSTIAGPPPPRHARRCSPPMKTKPSRRPQAHDWAPFLAAERPVERFSPHARHRLALGYANSYHVGMSSLGFQRTYELVHRTDGWAASASSSTARARRGRSRPARRSTASAASPSRSPSSRTTSTCCRCSTARASRCGATARPRRPPGRARRLVRGDQPAADGGFRRRLRRSARRRTCCRRCSAPCSRRSPTAKAVLERLAADPRLLRAGLPPAGGADRVSTASCASSSSPPSRCASPASCRHRDRHPAHRVPRQVPDRDVARLPRKVPLLLGDLRHGHVPLAPHRVHPRLSGARAAGDRPARLRRHRGGRPPGDRAHPARGVELGFRTSVSSIRIPAVTEGVLAALHASGDRSITLAPETGTDALRWKMGKPSPTRCCSRRSA
jgi:hypothetical protein